MDLNKKVIIITGASTGIGQELGFQFARKGSHVVLAARNKQALDQNAARIRESGGHVLAVPTDVSIRSQVDRLIQETVSHFGRVDILINNAGVSPAKGIILENSEKDVRDTMDINFMGSLYGVWAAAPIMMKNGGGLVVFVTSIIGKRGIPLNAAYCASKFAVQGLAESIRPELARKNIRIMTVCPPGVDTPFYENNGKGVRRGYQLHPTDKICRIIVKACESEKRELLPTLDAKLLHYLNFYAPSLMDWAIAKAKGV